MKLDYIITPTRSAIMAFNNFGKNWVMFNGKFKGGPNSAHSIGSLKVDQYFYIINNYTSGRGVPAIIEESNHKCSLVGNSFTKSSHNLDKSQNMTSFFKILNTDIIYPDNHFFFTKNLIGERRARNLFSINFFLHRNNFISEWRPLGNGRYGLVLPKNAETLENATKGIHFLEVFLGEVDLIFAKQFNAYENLSENDRAIANNFKIYDNKALVANSLLEAITDSIYLE